MFALMFLTSTGVPIVVGATVLGAFLFLPLPATLPKAGAGEGGQISHVYDANGDEIAVFREFEQNIPVKKEDIPLVLKQAVVSAEDRNFYRHGGVDLRGSVRALYADLRGGAYLQGGSTITQQYVRNAFVEEVGKERSISRKVREAILASQLDRETDKDEILYRYLSIVYFGEGAYGVGAAAQTYFRKPVSQLTLSEAALLAGVIPAPSVYAPRVNPEAAERKRQTVLNFMLEQKYIDSAQHTEAMGQPVHLLSGGPPPGPATVIHPPVQQENKYPYFVEYVRQYLIDKYGPAKVFKGGLKIQTTLDPNLQALADKAVRDALRGRKPPLEMSLVSVEPPTGYVKAMVGGRDFHAPGGQVNLALGKCPVMPPETEVVVAPSCREGDEVVVEGGGTGRQPGSSWKPFVLAAAFAKGFVPTRAYSGPSCIQISADYRPCNYEGSSSGRSDLRRATWKSINTVYVQLIRDVGVKETAEMAKKLGITSAWYGKGKFGHGISYALGDQEVSPLDMASAYGVFAARGLRATPTPVVKVIDVDGKVLEDNTKREGVRVLEEVIADNVTDVLRGVITSGTGTRANIGRPAAGKTGTTNDKRDAWFVGYTPTLSTAVWYGNRDKPSNLGVAGGEAAAPVWKAFMGPALKDVPVTEFNEPAPIKPIADELNRKARRGIDPGSRRQPSQTGLGGPYEIGPAAPVAPEPTNTTTTRPSGGTTTTTVGGGILFP